jgi:hypothetical protein
VSFQGHSGLFLQERYHPPQLLQRMWSIDKSGMAEYARMEIHNDPINQFLFSGLVMEKFSGCENLFYIRA